MEAWKKQSANGYMTISTHDTEAKPLFPSTSSYPFSTEEDAETFMAEKTNLRTP
jgi:hypothetical protein